MKRETVRLRLAVLHRADSDVFCSTIRHAHGHNANMLMISSYNVQHVVMFVDLPASCFHAYRHFLI